MCSSERKFPEFCKTHPTFVSRPLLVASTARQTLSSVFFGTPCTLKCISVPVKNIRILGRIQTHSLVKYTAVPKHTWGERQDIKEHNYATHTERDFPVGAKDNDNRGEHSLNIESHELDDAYC